MKIGNKDALMAALAIIGGDEEQREDEFTIQDIADAQNCTYDSAASRLYRATRAGQIEKRSIRRGGKQISLFRVKPTETKQTPRRK